MPDTALIVAIIGVVLTAIGTAIGGARLIIQHRRTPKLPEPPITPICTTILGLDINGHFCDLPGYSRPPSSMHRLDD